jgi:hypothetical protein
MLYFTLQIPDLLKEVFLANERKTALANRNVGRYDFSFET